MKGIFEIGIISRDIHISGRAIDSYFLLFYAVFSIHFDRDCLQKHKMLILSKMGHDWKIWDPFSKKNMLIPSFDVTIRRLFGIVTM